MLPPENLSLPDRNPVTYAKHKHEVLWQIALPVGVGILIVLILGALTIIGTDAMVNKGADVALIWLMMPVFVLSLILLVALLGVIYGVTNLIRIVPNYALQLLNLFIAIKNQVMEINNKLVQPMIKTEVFKASLQGLARAFKRR